MKKIKLNLYKEMEKNFFNRNYKVMIDIIKLILENPNFFRLHRLKNNF
jgi:hypothetical protein